MANLSQVEFPVRGNNLLDHLAAKGRDAVVDVRHLSRRRFLVKRDHAIAEPDIAHVESPLVPVNRHHRRPRLGQECLRQQAKIEWQERVAIEDQEPIVQKSGIAGPAQGAAGAPQFLAILGIPNRYAPAAAVADKLLDHFALEADAVHDLRYPVAGHPAQLVMGKGHARDRDQRLGKIGGQRSHPRAQAARQDRRIAFQPSVPPNQRREGVSGLVNTLIHGTGFGYPIAWTDPWWVGYLSTPLASS